MAWVETEVVGKLQRLKPAMQPVIDKLRFEATGIRAEPDGGAGDGDGGEYFEDQPGGTGVIVGTGGATSSSGTGMAGRAQAGN